MSTLSNRIAEAAKKKTEEKPAETTDTKKETTKETS